MTLTLTVPVADPRVFSNVAMYAPALSCLQLGISKWTVLSSQLMETLSSAFSSVLSFYPGYFWFWIPL